MPVRIVIEGLEPIRARFAQFPRQYKAAERTALQTSLLKIWEKVPAYPSVRKNWYIRTGMLGRSVGVSMEGSKMGPPDIYEIKQGANMGEATFGTVLGYAPKVIGEKSQEAPHIGRWWTLDGSVLRAARPEIEKLWQKMADKLANWLDGR